MVDGFSPNKLPDKGVEGAEILLNLSEPAGVVNGRPDLRPVSDDGRVAHEMLYIFISVLRYPRRVETVESFSQCLSSLEYELPRQTCLKSFEHQKLKQRSIIMDGSSPLLIMVLNVKWIVGIPTSYELLSHDIE